MPTRMIASTPLYVHIGAGKLGLGLVVPAIMSAPGRRLMIFNRASRNWHHQLLLERRSYRISENGEENKLIDGFDYVLGASEDQFAETCASTANVIITTAVGDGLPEVARHLAAAIERRASKNVHGLLIVLPCENLPGIGGRLTGEILTRISSQRIGNGAQESPMRNAMVLETIVDRICTHIRDDHGEVVVQAEPACYATWSILDPRTAGAESIYPHIESLGFVKILSEADMDIAWRRKLWCFNGLHLAAAARAHQAGIAPLHRVFEGEHLQRLRRLSHELSLALQFYSWNKYRRDTHRENLKFSRLAMERIAANREDVPGRILRNLLDLERIATTESVAPDEQLAIAAHQMDSFLEKLQDRLGAPAQHLFLNARALSRRSAELQTGLHLLLCIKAMHRVFRSLKEARG